jgi:hypothetical protein
VVRKRWAKARSVTFGSFAFTLDNRLFKLGWREIQSVMITPPVASRVYVADLLYTSSGGGDIAFDINGKQVSGPITISFTYNASDRSPGGDCITGRSQTGSSA